MHHQFRSDYIELADKRILDALSKYSLEQNIPYGFDYHSENASKYILDTFGSKEGRVYFLEGGTQTNLLFISYCLRHYEGVIAADTGHINVHESAAVEGSGYKISNVNAGKSLDVDNNSLQDGGNVLLWSENGDANQRWNIEEVGDGYVTISNVNSGKLLDVDNGSMSDGGNVLQWANNGDANQQWKLVPV